MSAVAGILNKLESNEKSYDPLGYALVGKTVHDYRHSTEAQTTTAAAIDPNAAAAEQDAAGQATAAKLTRGRTSTVLNGEAGLSNLGNTSKVLLGQ